MARCWWKPEELLSHISHSQHDLVLFPYQYNGGQGIKEEPDNERHNSA